MYILLEAVRDGNEFLMWEKIERPRNDRNP